MEILTAEQARQARESLGLSQRRVSAETGLARNVLGLFEAQRVVPEDDFLETLRDFYNGEGAELAEPVEDDVPPEQPPSPGPQPGNGGKPAARSTSGRRDVRVVDGFAVPVGMEPAQVESLLDAIGGIQDELETLLAQPVEFDAGLFGRSVSDPPTEESRKTQQRIRLLMARGYCLVRQLQGREAIGPCTRIVGEFGEGGHKGDQQTWLRQVFGDLFGFLDEDTDPDSPSERTDTNWLGLGRTRDREGMVETEGAA